MRLSRRGARDKELDESCNTKSSQTKRNLQNFTNGGYQPLVRNKTKDLRSIEGL
jgi:hypothetical protein